MKRNNKKGFTIVELVIVIAVIAILAAVMIPTFAGIVEKANESKALQEAQNKYKELYALDLADGELDGKEGEESMTVTDYTVTTEEGSSEPTISFTYTADNGYTVTYNGTTWTATKGSDASDS